MNWSPNDVAFGVLVIGGVLVGVLFVLWSITRLVHVCRPDEVLVFSGRGERAADGSNVGSRIITAGRGFRVPLLEKVDRMDTSLITVPMSIRGAYSEGGIPLDVQAVANVKISTEPALVRNALERFLGHPTADVGRVAKETLEGHLRGVLATMTPEEVNQDRLKFADRLAEEAGHDLRKLGLQLDILKIQHVSDDRSYLDSIGRTRMAEIVREALVAESDAVRVAEQAESAAHANGNVAQSEASARIDARLNGLRQFKAELEARVRSEEGTAEAAAEQARAEAERELQTVRGELEQLRLRADVVIPAETERQVRQLLAEGDAAAIAERGQAVAAGLALVQEAWKACGDQAMAMVVAQNLEAIVGQAAQAAAALHAREATLIDPGDGRAVARYASGYPATVSALLRELSGILGVDLVQSVSGRTGEDRPGGPREKTTTAIEVEREAA